MQPASAPAALRVQAALGDGFRVLEFDASTRTAAEAAAAIGCTVAQIAKSILFRAAGGGAVLVVASGVNRVDEGKVAALLGEAVGRADAGFVRAATGFAIGGVPPVGHVVGHAGPVRVVLDRDLCAFEAIWAAAGTPNAVFRLTPAELARLTGAAFAEVAKR